MPDEIVLSANIEAINLHNAEIPQQTMPSKMVQFAPFGNPVTAGEVQNRLSASLYKQLSEDSHNTTVRAIERAQVSSGAIFHNLNVAFDLDNQIVREIVLILTVYEMHIALGHEEAGREYRIQAKNIITAAFGRYPDSEDSAPAAIPCAVVASVQKPPRNWRDYSRALERM